MNHPGSGECLILPCVSPAWSDLHRYGLTDAGYCLLLERRLHKVFSSEEIKVTWRAHELRPFPVPTLKMEDEYLPRVWSDSVYPLAEQIGVDIRLPRISPQPRTDKAFEAHLFAADNGAGETFPAAVMIAFFQQERNIGDIDVLVDIGGEVIVEKSRDPENRRSFIYTLTEKGRDLAPIILDIVSWSGRHDHRSFARRGVLQKIKKDRKGLEAKLRKG